MVTLFYLFRLADSDLISCEKTAAVCVEWWNHYSTTSSLVRMQSMSMHLQPSSKEEIEYVTRFLWAKDRRPSEIHSQLSQVYGERAMKYQEVQLLCHQFGNGRIRSLGDNQDSTFSLNRDEFLSQVVKKKEIDKKATRFEVSCDIYI